MYSLWNDITKHMQSLGILLGAHMNTSVITGGRVITRGRAWAQLQRKGTRDHQGSTLGFQTWFLEDTRGRYYPTAVREHTLDFHKKHTRIPQVNNTENSSNNFWIPCENTRIRMSHWWNIWTIRKQLQNQWNKGIIVCSSPGDTRNSHVNMRDSSKTKGWQ